MSKWFGTAGMRVWLALGAILFASLGCKTMGSGTPGDASPGSNSPTEFAAPATNPAQLLPTPAAPGSGSPVPTLKDGETPVDDGGLTLVYTKAGGLWRWQNGRTEALKLSGSAYAPNLSPDGRTVAFLRPADEFHIELWAVDLDSSRERKLVSVMDLDAIGGGQRDPSAVAINPYSFAWIPGSGRRLAFNTHQVFNGPGLVLLDDLHVVDVDTGQILNLLPSGQGGEFTFSPDGAKIAISRSDMIVLTNIDGTNSRQVLAYPLVLTYSEYRFYAAPVWSQDGKYLRVAIPPEDPLADPSAQSALWRIPIDGDAVREGSVSAVPFFDTPVIYSPDLQRVAFIRESGTPADNRRALHLATFDGGGDWEAAHAPMLQFESWSPDGRKYLYTAGDEMEAFVGSLDAAASPLGAQCSGAVDLRWVDDHRLICTVQSPGAFDLMLLDLDGGALLLDTVTGNAPVFDLAH